MNRTGADEEIIRVGWSIPQQDQGLTKMHREIVVEVQDRSTKSWIFLHTWQSVLLAISYSKGGRPAPLTEAEWAYAYDKNIW